MFEIAAGTIVGSDHRWSGRNNQDAFCISQSPEAAIAVVCDGCSEGRQSEVGAQIGSRLVVRAIRRGMEIIFRDSEFWPGVLAWSQQKTIRILQEIVLNMEGRQSHLVSDYFLFTVVGVALTSEDAVFFSFGDGVFAVNGEVSRVGPFPNNAPPYLAYGGLVKSSLGDNPELLKFAIHKIVPTAELNNGLIGTDGVVDLVRAADSRIPGKTEAVGALSQFWTEDSYFANPDAVRRKLSLLNQEVVRPDWENRCLAREKRLLPDDTTLIVFRRKKEKGELM